MNNELSSEERTILDRYLNRSKNMVVSPSKKEPAPIATSAFDLNIERLLKSKDLFYNDTKKGNDYIGLLLALADAEKFVKEKGSIIATMPYLIAGKANAYITDANNIKTHDNGHKLWANWLTALTEEDVGIDEKGVYVPKGNPVLITIHGGGFLNAATITNAYAKGLTPQNAANLDQKAITIFLKDGILPSGEKIQIYQLNDLKKGISNPFGRYAVITDFSKVQSLESKQFQKTDFVANPLVLSRAGTMDYIDNYFEFAKDSNGVGCYHRFGEIDSSVAQGRLLFLDINYLGLGGDGNLNDDGRFVGVAPEAHRAKK